MKKEKRTEYKRLKVAGRAALSVKFKTLKTKKLKRKFKNKSFPKAPIKKQYYFGIFFALAAFYFIYPTLSAKLIYFSIFICAWIVLNTLIYPYTAFTLNHLIHYWVDGNNFHLPKVISSAITFVFMILCWGFSVILLPLGLLWYYFIYYDPDAEFY